jgi:hypothetical protein
MRSVLLAVVAVTLSAPALAAPSKTTRDAQAMAERLNDPVMQAAMAGGINAMLGALLDMRLDGIAKALEPLNGGKRVDLKGRTVREMAERDDPYFEEKLQGGTRAVIGGMGAMASALATAMPELERAMAKMGEAMDKAQQRLPDAR